MFRPSWPLGSEMLLHTMIMVFSPSCLEDISCLDSQAAMKY